MKIIVGLGNPGRKYFDTRHNVGFLFLDYLKQKFSFSEFSLKSNLKASISEGFINGEKILFVKPTTFMNLSGEAVLLVMNYYKVDIADVLIVFDDVDLSFGNTRFRKTGRPGTHNGLKDVLLKLNSMDVPRLKIGIEVEDRRSNLSDFVLSSFHKTELDSLSSIFEEGFDLVKSDFF